MYESTSSFLQTMKAKLFLSTNVILTRGEGTPLHITKGKGVIIDNDLYPNGILSNIHFASMVLWSVYILPFVFIPLSR